MVFTMIGFFIRIRNSLIYRIRFAYFRLTTNYWKFIKRILISNKRETKQRESLFVWVPVWGNRDAQTMMGTLPIQHYISTALDNHVKGIKKIVSAKGEKPLHVNFL